MPPKKTVEVVSPPVVETPAVAPVVESTLTPKEIQGLGVREHDITINDKPVVMKKDGSFNTMEFRNVVERHNIRQPYLNVNEVKQLGTRHWWPHRVAGEFTTVVSGTRFILTAANFEECKNLGLVIGCSLREAGQHRT